MASAEDREFPFNEPVRERRAFDPRVVTRVELAPPVARVAWSGIWAGFLIALGIFLVLATFGAAVGLSNIGPGSNLSAGTVGRTTTTWLYISALVALFFGGAFGTRLAMVVDGTVAWLEATLIWTFALVLTTILATAVASLAVAHPAAAQSVVETNPAAVNLGAIRATAWLTFIGIVIGWVVTVLGSFWGRAQARGRARALGLAA